MRCITVIITRRLGRIARDGHHCIIINLCWSRISREGIPVQPRRKISRRRSAIATSSIPSWTLAMRKGSGAWATLSTEMKRHGTTRCGLMDGRPNGTRYHPFIIQYYLFSSPKLRHLRTMTQGYTGQKVHPAIRTGWKF